MHEAKCEGKAKAKRNLKKGFYQNVNLRKRVSLQIFKLRLCSFEKLRLSSVALWFLGCFFGLEPGFFVGCDFALAEAATY